MRRVFAVLVFLIARAAFAADTPPPAQPSAPVNKTADSTNSNANAAKPTADAPAKPTSAKPAPDPKADDKTKDRDFRPSEEISEDMAVAYPVDI